MVAKTKRYQVNYNGASYNVRTGAYERRDVGNMTYAEASRDKWKCEKCSVTFSSIKMLMFHKNQIHSY